MRAGHIQTRVKHAPNLPEDGMWSPKGGKIESGHIRLPSYPRHEENAEEEEEEVNIFKKLFSPLKRAQQIELGTINSSETCNGTLQLVSCWGVTHIYRDEK